MEKNFFKKGRISITYISKSIAFGAGYDKPYLFIIFGIILIEIDMSKPVKKKIIKRMPPTNDYFYYHDNDH